MSIGFTRSPPMVLFGVLFFPPPPPPPETVELYHGSDFNKSPILNLKGNLLDILGADKSLVHIQANTIFRGPLSYFVKNASFGTTLSTNALIVNDKIQEIRSSVLFSLTVNGSSAFLDVRSAGVLSALCGTLCY